VTPQFGLLRFVASDQNFAKRKQQKACRPCLSREIPKAVILEQRTTSIE
jgi:hypothetical protein